MRFRLWNRIFSTRNSGLQLFGVLAWPRQPDAEGHRLLEFIGENINKSGHDSRQRALRVMYADELAFQHGLDNASGPQWQIGDGLLRDDGRQHCCQLGFGDEFQRRRQSVDLDLRHDLDTDLFGSVIDNAANAVPARRKYEGKAFDALERDGGRLILRTGAFDEYEPFVEQRKRGQTRLAARVVYDREVKFAGHDPVDQCPAIGLVDPDRNIRIIVAET